MNLYAYCGNNSINRVDPSGLAYRFLDWWNENTKKNVRGQPLLTFAWINDDDPFDVKVIWSGGNIDEWCNWAANNPYFDGRDDLPNIEDRSGWDLAQRLVNPGDKGTHYTKEGFFWRLQALQYLGVGQGIIATIEQSGELDNIQIKLDNTYQYDPWMRGSRVVKWNPSLDYLYDGSNKWNRVDPLAMLVHELTHLADDLWGGIDSRESTEIWAMKNENDARYALWRTNFRYYGSLYPRPGYFNDNENYSDRYNSMNAITAWIQHIYIFHWQVRY
jgi:hypothetical protein